MKNLTLLLLCFLISSTIFATENPEKEANDSIPVKINHLTKGLFHQFEFGGLTEIDGYLDGVEYTYTFGYRFSPHFSLGAGIGYYHFSPDHAWAFFAHGRGYILRKKITPFIGTKIGLLRSVLPHPHHGGKEIFSGLMVEPEIGVRLNIKKKFGVHIALGMNIHQTRRIYSVSHGYGYYGTGRYNVVDFVEYMNLKIGISF